MSCKDGRVFINKAGTEVVEVYGGFPFLSKDLQICSLIHSERVSGVGGKALLNPTLVLILK